MPESLKSLFKIIAEKKKKGVKIAGKKSEMDSAEMDCCEPEIPELVYMAEFFQEVSEWCTVDADDDDKTDIADTNLCNDKFTKFILLFLKKMTTVITLFGLS